MNSNQDLLTRLKETEVFHQFERAFSDITGLPVALRPVQSWQLPHHGRRNESSFCALMAAKSAACAACLQVHQQVADACNCEDGSGTVTCQHGLIETAVPLRVGDQLIGYLQIGQVFRKRPTEAQFQRSLKQIQDWGIQIDAETLRKSYFGTRVLGTREHEAAVNLLKIFGAHFSAISNEIITRQKHAEPPIIAKAREYIQAHYSEDLSLGQVAKAVNVSTFYFCKIFRRFTGLNFTEFVSRVRIERAKQLLLNPHLRVSEIAYEVGFQSLTHFNRVFKRVLGESPTVYRSHLSAVAA